MFLVCSLEEERVPCKILSESDVVKWVSGEKVERFIEDHIYRCTQCLEHASMILITQNKYFYRKTNTNNN